MIVTVLSEKEPEKLKFRDIPKGTLVTTTQDHQIWLKTNDVETKQNDAIVGVSLTTSCLLYVIYLDSEVEILRSSLSLVNSTIV